MLSLESLSFLLSYLQGKAFGVVPAFSMCCAAFFLMLARAPKTEAVEQSGLKLCKRFGTIQTSSCRRCEHSRCDAHVQESTESIE